MGFALPAGVVNTDSVYFYVLDGASPLGPLVKEPSDQTLVVLDYSKLSTAITIIDWTFTPDISTNPELVVSFPQVDSLGRVMTFLLSGGIAGQQYKIAIAVRFNVSAGVTSMRTDTLTVSMPSSGDCGCEVINQVPVIYSELPLGLNGYANTAIRLFWGDAPPANPNALDQWYDTNNKTLYEWMTDGTVYFWEIIAAPNFVTEAPFTGLIYGRYAGVWIPDPIQNDAPMDLSTYGRNNGDWQLIPRNPIVADAPVDDTPYGRQNSNWVSLSNPSPSNSNPIMDGVAAPGVSPNYARAGHVHPTDTSRYAVSNPAGYVTIGDVNGALTGYMPTSGGVFSGPVSFNVTANFSTPANLTIGGGSPGQVLSASSGVATAWADPGIAEAPNDSLVYARKNKAWLAFSTSAVVTVSAAPPATPAIGSLWWDATGGQMYVFYDDGNTQQWVPVVNQAGGFLGLGGGVLTGGLVVQGPVDLKVQTVTQAGAALSINRTLGENIAVTVTANITSIAVTNWPASGVTGKVRMVITNNGTFSMSGWPAGTIWPGGVAPSLSSGVGKKDILLLMSDNAGVTIFGSIVGQDYR